MSFTNVKCPWALEEREKDQKARKSFRRTQSAEHLSCYWISIVKYITATKEKDSNQ